MKFRVFAGAAAMAILLATTACGGNLANNAGALRHDGIARNGVVRVGDVPNGVIRDGYSATHRGAYNNGRAAGTRTGRVGRTVRSTGMDARRLGNAVTNTRNTLHNGVNQTNTMHNNTLTRQNRNTANVNHNRTNANINHNRTNANVSHNRTNAVVNHNRTNANAIQNNVGGLNTNTNRTNVNHNMQGTQLDGNNRTGAYSNTNNFDNAVYYGNENQNMNANRNFGENTLGQSRMRQNAPAATPRPAVNNEGRTMVDGTQQNGRINNTMGVETQRNIREGYLINDNSAFDGTAVRNNNQVRENAGNVRHNVNTGTRTAGNTTAQRTVAAQRGVTQRGVTTQRTIGTVNNMAQTY